MRITNFATDKNINDEIVDLFLIDLDERNARYYIIEPDFEEALNINTDIVLHTVNAINNLERLSRTLTNLNLENNLDREVLFDVFRAVMRGDCPSVELLQRYFNLVAEIDCYYDKFAYMNDESDNSAIEFRPDVSIDFYLLGLSHWLNDSNQYAQRIDDFFILRYSFISNEIDFSEFRSRIKDLT